MTLILSSRNLTNQSGARNLILKRAIAQNLIYKDQQNLISFSTTSEVDSLNVFVRSGILTTPIKVNKKSLWSLIYGYLRLFKEVRSQDYKTIIITGYFPIIFIIMLKVFCKKSKLIYDIHGAVEEKIEYPRSFLFKEFIIYLILKINAVLIYNILNDHFVVSHSLKEYVKKYRIHNKNCNFHVIPCTDLKPKDYNFIRNNEKLPYQFIYTGSDAPWQCLRETLFIFKEINRNYPSELTLLISNPNYVVPEEYKDLPISIFSVSAEEVSDFLKKSDFAFLIRKKDYTNKVAYPNKFYDYISHGIPVITTKAIDDIYSAINKYSLGAIIDLEEFNCKSIISECLNSISENNFKDYAKKTSFQSTLMSFYSEK